MIPTVSFHDSIPDKKLKYAVIVAKYNSKWLYCKHKSRQTYEIPGGKRERDESILSCAKRELTEETGALVYRIRPVTIYSVTRPESNLIQVVPSYGMLYYADIEQLDSKLQHEIELVKHFDDMPDVLTYHNIQPHLLRFVLDWLQS